MMLRIWILLFSLCGGAQSVGADEIKPQVSWTESEMMNSIDAIAAGDLDLALDSLDRLTALVPEYELAHFMKAEILAMQAGETQLVNSQRKRYPSKIKRLMKEAKLRFQEDELGVMNRLHHYLIESHAPYAIVVNTELQRLYLYKAIQKAESSNKKNYILRASYYISIGKKGAGKRFEGDQKTPLGLYFINEEKLAKELPDLYGIGALTLNYPNAWDRYKKRTGYGIWLHGMNASLYSRPPQSSQGCVVLNNRDMKGLMEYVKASTLNHIPVILTAHTEGQFIENATKMIQKNEWLANNLKNTLIKQGRISLSEANQISVYRYPSENSLFVVKTKTQTQYWKWRNQKWQALEKVNQKVKLVKSR